jgi:hypothetical protein
MKKAFENQSINTSKCNLASMQLPSIKRHLRCRRGQNAPEVSTSMPLHSIRRQTRAAKPAQKPVKIKEFLSS